MQSGHVAKKTLARNVSVLGKLSSQSTSSRRRVDCKVFCWDNTRNTIEDVLYVEFKRAGITSTCATVVFVLQKVFAVLSAQLIRPARLQLSLLKCSTRIPARSDAFKTP
ncbi:hypothetical protein VTN96DRAFT_9281 [Rasamsonia emersonii]